MKNRFKLFLLIMVLAGISVLIGGCVPQNEAERHFNNATAFLEQGMFKEAIIELKNGLRLKKKDEAFNNRPEKPTLLATIYLYDNKMDEARIVLEEAVKKYKTDWNIHLILATIYMNKKEYRKAAETMEEVPLRVQDYGEIDLMRGLRYLGENRYEEAEKRFRQAKDKFLAQSLKFKQESGSSQFIKAGATIMINTLLGNVYDKESKLPEAAAAYEAALAVNPNSEVLKANVDIISRKIYLGKNPQDANAHNSLGWLYYQKGLLGEAISEYQLAIKQNPSYALAYNNLGLVYFDKKEHQTAISYFNKAIVLNNDPKASEYAYYNLGRTYRRNKDAKRAVENLSKALGLNPPSLPAQREYKIAFLLNEKSINYLDLGNQYYENDEYSSALSAYKKYLTKKTNSFQAYYYSGQCYLKLGGMQKAVVQFEKAVDIDPLSGKAHRSLGLVYAKLGDYDKAVSELKLAVKSITNTELPAVYDDLAYAQMEKGDTDSAVKYWKTVIRLDNNKADRIEKILGVIG